MAVEREFSLIGGAIEFVALWEVLGEASHALVMASESVDVLEDESRPLGARYMAIERMRAAMRQAAADIGVVELEPRTGVKCHH